MNTMTQQSLMIDRDDLVSLMTDAYSQGMAAGQIACQADADPDFEVDAVELFSSGFSAMLADPVNKLAA